MMSKFLSRLLHLFYLVCLFNLVTAVTHTDAYFRKTGLERSKALSNDLEWLRQQDIVVPEPSNPAVAYVKYLEELANKSQPLFLCHFYNIYFSHMAGGQVIAKQVYYNSICYMPICCYSLDCVKGTAQSISIFQLIFL